MDEKKKTLRHPNEPQAPEEKRVAEDVSRALAASGRFPSGRLEVSASRGVVTLRGRVASYYQKQLAQAAALHVIGTRQLVNDVEVR